MSLLAASQIPKPSDEQAFERASVALWRGLLNDPNVQRNGRRGQRQNGVDLFGMRNGDPAHYVGIQCKAKSEGRFLTEDEVRDEVKKALTFKPELREYFIVTTAPDDVALQELARELTADLKAKGRTLPIYVWGWNTLEERISENAEARKAFDPDYGAFSDQILEVVSKVTIAQEEFKLDIGGGFSEMRATLARVEKALVFPPGDATNAVNALEAHLDADIDTFREMAISGKPKTALTLLEGLLARIKDTASGRILFRLKANIGSCMLALGEDDRAAGIISEAYEHAPSEPKAIANKAFSLLLQGRWDELLSFGSEAIQADPANEQLAGYLVQAARFDPSIDEPLDLLPNTVKNSAAVAIARVVFLRHRNRIPDWWLAAREAVASHPKDLHARQFAAEADIDEVVRDEEFRRSRLFKSGDRARLQSATDALVAQWDEARSKEGMLRPEHSALCGNLIVAFHALGNMPRAIEVARQGLALAPNDVEIAKRAAMAAIDGHDEGLAQQTLPLLPESPDAMLLAFRFHADRNDWAAIAELCIAQSAHIPEVERVFITTAGRLSQIKTAPKDDVEGQINMIAAEVADDPRASIVVADFARMEGLEAAAEQAYQAALARIDGSSHIASRLMVAMHAAKRGDWKVVADLLDGHVAEDHDSNELRMLTRALERFPISRLHNRSL
ncbi:MAG: hypothetical protein WA733_07930 [Methylocystis sp.]